MSDYSRALDLQHQYDIYTRGLNLLLAGGINQNDCQKLLNGNFKQADSFPTKFSFDNTPRQLRAPAFLNNTHPQMYSPSGLSVDSGSPFSAGQSPIMMGSSSPPPMSPIMFSPPVAMHPLSSQFNTPNNMMMQSAAPAQTGGFLHAYPPHSHSNSVAHNVTRNNESFKKFCGICGNFRENYNTQQCAKCGSVFK